MNKPSPITRAPFPPQSYAAIPRVSRTRRPADPALNTLDQALRFAHSYSQEIRKDSKSRRIYRSFAALAETQFEALLAFSIWKVRNLSLPQADPFAEERFS